MLRSHPLIRNIIVTRHRSSSSVSYSWRRRTRNARVSLSAQRQAIDKNHSNHQRLQPWIQSLSTVTSNSPVTYDNSSVELSSFQWQSKTQFLLEQYGNGVAADESLSSSLATSSVIPELELCLQYWSSQRIVTEQSIHTSFQLLDALLLLYHHHHQAAAAATATTSTTTSDQQNNNNSNDTNTNTSSINAHRRTHWLNLALNHWRLGILDTAASSVTPLQQQLYSVPAIWNRFFQNQSNNNNDHDALVSIASTESFRLFLSAAAGASPSTIMTTTTTANANANADTIQQPRQPRPQSQLSPLLAKEVLDTYFSSLLLRSKDHYTTAKEEEEEQVEKQKQTMICNTVLRAFTDYHDRMDANHLSEAANHAMRMYTQMKHPYHIPASHETFALVLLALSHSARFISRTIVRLPPIAPAAVATNNDDSDNNISSSNTNTNNNDHNKNIQEHEENVSRLQACLVDQMWELFDDMRTSHIIPTEACYLNAFQTLIYCQRLDAANELLQQCITTYKCDVASQSVQEERGNNSSSIDSDRLFKPTPAMINAVMLEYAKRDDVLPVVAIWNDLLALYPNEDDLHLESLSFVLNNVIALRSFANLERAQALLEHIVQRGDHVDTACYNIVLRAWAELAHKDPTRCVNQAEAFLLTIPSPNTDSYTLVIKAWALSDLPMAAYRCSAFLQAMWDYHDAQQQAARLAPSQSTTTTTLSTASVKPSVATYSAVMFAWSRAQVDTAPREVEKIFNDMKHRYIQGDVDLYPNEASYVAIMTVWNRSKNAGRAARRVQAFFDEWKSICLSNEKPIKLGIYHLLLQSKQAADDGISAEHILNEMLSLSGQGQAYDKSVSFPTRKTFHIVISAIVKSRKPDAPDRAIALIKLMYELEETYPWCDCKPNANVLALVFKAFADSTQPDAAEKATALLERMRSSARQDSTPNAMCYGMVLRAWSNSNLDDAALRAQALFDDILKRYENGDDTCRPNAEACTALLVCWTRSTQPNAPQIALSLLEAIEARHFRKDRKFEHPNWNHYDVVMQNFAKRGDIVNALKVMDKLHKYPHITTPSSDFYNGLLREIVKTESERASEYAMYVLNEMPKRGKSQPNHLTYTHCIGALEFSNDPGAFKEAERLLHLCLYFKLNPTTKTFVKFIRVLRTAVLRKTISASEKIKQTEELIQLLTRERIHISLALQEEMEALEKLR